MYLLADQGVRLAQEGCQVFAAQVHAHGQVTAVHLARNKAGTEPRRHFGDGGKRDMRTGSRGQRQGGNLLGRVAHVFPETADDVVNTVADIHLGHGTAADRRFDQLCDIGDIDAVVSGFFAVGRNLELRQRRFLVDDHVCRAGDAGEDTLDFFGDAPVLVQVVTVHLQGQVAVGTGNLVHHHIDDRLGEAHAEARHQGDRVGHLGNQVVLALAPFPLPVGLQADAYFHMGRREGFGAFVVAAHLGHDIGHFVERLEFFAQFVGHPG